MGLDITAYKQLTPAPDGDPEDWDHFYCPGPSAEWSESVWPGRAAGISDLTATYGFVGKHHFRAGSYGGYNEWRRLLAEFAAMLNDTGAFSELIQFADNEGVIGPVVSAKLAADFARHAGAAGLYNATLPQPWRGGWLSRYEGWREAFEFAADGGAVAFH